MAGTCRALFYVSTSVLHKYTNVNTHEHRFRHECKYKITMGFVGFRARPFLLPMQIANLGSILGEGILVLEGQCAFKYLFQQFALVK